MTRYHSRYRWCIKQKPNKNNLETKIGRKTTVWTPQRENLDIAEKGKLLERNWTFLRTAQNNAIRVDKVNAWIEKAQQNHRYRLCGDREEMINQIISEYSK